jgi:MSHA biogenesis protein MshI
MMWAKFGTKFSAGWGAVVRQGERLDLVHAVAQTGKRPVVHAFDSFCIETDEADALSRLAAARNLKRLRCVNLLDEGQYSLIQLEAPAGPVEERVDTLRWRLKDSVDFPVDNAALAIIDIPSDGGRQPGVFAVAASAEVIGARMALFRQARLSLEAIDIPELALRNVATLYEEDNRGLAFVALTEQTCMLVITFRGELILSRRIDITSAALARADEERRLQLLERLALELQRTLDNFDRQYGYVSISRLIVASEHDAAGTVAALTQNLYLPIVAMDLAEVLDFPDLPDLKSVERQAQGLMALGAAFRT